MSIPFVTFLPMERELNDDIRAAFDRVYTRSWYIEGVEDEAFEKAFAEYCGAKYCVGVGNGLDALMLALKALGIGEGDEVIVPSNTYIATALAVTYVGATPVFVEPDIRTFNINPDLIEAAITSKTKAIMPVHLYGQACDMTVVKAVAGKYNLSVIEDCAQCHGAKWNGRFTGTEGTLSCFSFYPTKPLGALGDAGAICTNDDILADKIRMLRNYGSRVKYHNESIGRNSRLDEIQAALLCVGLKHLNECNEIRLKIAQQYLNSIHNDKLKLPVINPKATHVFHLFPVLVDCQEKFQQYLLNNGIKTQVHYPIPPFEAECFRNTDAGVKDGDKMYPNSYYTAKHEVSLPIYSGMSESDVKAVIQAVNSY